MIFLLLFRLDRFVNRNYSLHEVYDMRRNQIRSNHLDSNNEMDYQGGETAPGHQHTSYTSDDIDAVYMPWMMENYGRKLAIEALKRRGNMCGESSSQTTLSAPRQNILSNQQQQQQVPLHKRTKSPYVSQYYAQINDRPSSSSSIRPNDIWLIDRGIRRRLKRSMKSSTQQQTVSFDENQSDEVSITDSDTSSDDPRPIVPERINKPDVSLKNKILKTINKSLLSRELTGIDLNMLKLNDFFRRIVKRIEKRALDRDLELDLIRSFSCSHLADLRKEDMRQINMRRRLANSYTTDDIIDIYMPKSLEAYKLKVAIEREKKMRNGCDMTASTMGDALSRISSHQQTQAHSPLHQPIQIKSPNKPSSSSPTQSPLSPPPLNSAFRNNPSNLFRQIIQERLNEIDHKMAQEISSSTRQHHYSSISSFPAGRMHQV